MCIIYILIIWMNIQKKWKSVSFYSPECFTGCTLLKAKRQPWHIMVSYMVVGSMFQCSMCKTAKNMREKRGKKILSPLSPTKVHQLSSIVIWCGVDSQFPSPNLDIGRWLLAVVRAIFSLSLSLFSVTSQSVVPLTIRPISIFHHRSTRF